MSPAGPIMCDAICKTTKGQETRGALLSRGRFFAKFVSIAVIESGVRISLNHGDNGETWVESIIVCLRQSGFTATVCIMSALPFHTHFTGHFTSAVCPNKARVDPRVLIRWGVRDADTGAGCLAGAVSVSPCKDNSPLSRWTLQQQQPQCKFQLDIKFGGSCGVW